MSRSRRTIAHPPVRSTTDHAEAEAALLARAAARTETKRPITRGARIPNSPASLWMSEGRKRFRVERVDDAVPTALNGWVAPVIVVTALPL